MHSALLTKYRPHSPQRRLHAIDARWVAVLAGTRGGKTLGVAAEFLTRVFEAIAAGKMRDVPATGNRRRRPRLHYWVVAPEYALLAEPRRAIMELLPADMIECWYDSEGQLWLKGGVLIEFKSADKPLSLVSVGLDGLWLDECARIKADAWRGQLRQRLSDRQGFALFSTTPLGRGWLHSDIIDRALSKVPDYGFVTWKTSDNPYIASAEIEAARRDLSDKYFRREYEANSDAFAGRILDEMNPTIHVISEKEWRLKMGYPQVGDIPFVSVVAGIDHGFTAPSCITVVGELRSGMLVMLEESYGPGRRPIHDIPEQSLLHECRRLTEKWHITKFLADPEDAGGNNDLRRHGIQLQTASNNIANGIRCMARALRVVDGQPRMYVFNTCKNWIREAQSWSWATTRDGGDFTEEPAAGQSEHALDASRYALVELIRYEKTGFEPVYKRSGIGPIGG